MGKKVMPFFLKNTIFVARKILTTTDRHLLERAIFIGSCLLHHRWRSLYEGDEEVKARHPSWRTGHGGHRPTFFTKSGYYFCIVKEKIVNLPMLKMLL